MKFSQLYDKGSVKTVSGFSFNLLSSSALISPTVFFSNADETHPWGTILNIGYVAGATGYKIYRGGQYISRSDESSRTYDMSSYEIPGTYDVYVIAYNDSEESEPSRSVTFQVTLNAPTLYLASQTQCILNFFIENNPFSETYYVFYQNDTLIPSVYWTASYNSNTGMYTVTISDNAFSGMGSFQITSQAMSNDENYPDSPLSNIVTYTKSDPLESPVLVLSGDTLDGKFPNGYILSWSEVTGATGYKIYSNGSYVSRPVESLRYYEMSADNIPGTYNIYVTAYNDTKESEPSNIVIFKVSLEAPELTLQESDYCIISFDIGNNPFSETYYVFYKNDILIPSNYWTADYDYTEEKYTVTIFPHSNVFPSDGTYKITAQAMSSDALYSESPISDFVLYVYETGSNERLTQPVLTNLSTSTTCMFSFERDTRAYAYRVYLDGVEQGYPTMWTASLSNNYYTVTMKDACFPTAGTYRIEVQAYVLNGNYKDSFVSSPPLYFTKN